MAPRKVTTKLWSSEDLRRLIPLLEQTELLYNPLCPEYMDKIKRRNAVDDISNAFEGRYSSDDIKQKIHGLRAQFCGKYCLHLFQIYLYNNLLILVYFSPLGERAKIRKRIKSGVSAQEATRMCKWEFFNALKFMFPNYSEALDIEESFVSLYILYFICKYFTIIKNLYIKLFY